MTTIDEYVAQFSPETQALLEAVRKTIQTAAPEATEKISWAMPTYFFHGNVIHFAVHKTHLGIYPGPACIEAFAKQLAPLQNHQGRCAISF